MYCMKRTDQIADAHAHGGVLMVEELLESSVEIGVVDELVVVCHRARRLLAVAARHLCHARELTDDQQHAHEDFYARAIPEHLLDERRFEAPALHIFRDNFCTNAGLTTPTRMKTMTPNSANRSLMGRNGDRQNHKNQDKMRTRMYCWANTSFLLRSGLRTLTKAPSDAMHSLGLMFSIVARIAFGRLNSARTSCMLLSLNILHQQRCHPALLAGRGQEGPC
jgi:hypothetical protein